MAKPVPIRNAGLFFLFWLLPATLFAGEISVPLPSGLKALADYREGSTEKPAVLVLHGILQTHRFSTIRLIAEEISDAGYAVLSPSLTLNINERHASLTCDAIQSHTVKQATNEINAWIVWLKKRGYRNIILIGHSTGSNHLLDYLHTIHEPAVRALIATSAGPIDSWKHSDESAQQIAEAREAIAAGDNSLRKFSLGFCLNNYTAPPASFLSYMQWNRTNVLRLLRSSPVPTTVVLGQADNWLPPDWAMTIKREGIPLVLIKDANHYFSGIAEFDFQNAVLSLVEGITENRRKHNE